ncbi:MAG: hypothetical protein Q4F65_00710 [Propionibacteriaceae bacterium]|nr:hypothetical protein [Propionibacteriaceae bacterium]
MDISPGQNASLVQRIRGLFRRRATATREQQEARVRAAAEQERVENAYDDLRMKRKFEQRPLGPL